MVYMNRYRKIILLSLKIGIGSSLSLYAAQKLGLNYAVSAGTITLLSAYEFKVGNYKAVWQQNSFIFNNSACRMAFIYTYKQYVDSIWDTTHIYSVMAEILDWRATISVNGVIAAHLVTYENFNDAAVWNELGIVLVGVGFAIVFKSV